MLDDPVARQVFARNLVDSSKPKNPDADPRDVLTPFSRDLVGVKNVMLNIPLRDPVEVRRYLALLEETCRELRLRLVQHGTDQSHLFMVRGVMRQLNKKMNAYRKPRPD